jgi:hypothetical protein
MTTVRSDLFTSCCSTRACRKNRPASSPTTDTKLDIEATLTAALETIGKARKWQTSLSARAALGAATGLNR